MFMIISLRYILAISVMFIASSCAYYPPQNHQIRSPSSKPIVQKSEFGPQIHVLIWNAFKGSKQGFKKDASLLMRNKDLTLFQECVLEDEFQELISQNDQLEVNFAKSWGSNGVCTSSQVASLDTLAIKTEVRELFVFTPKSTLITTYPMRDREDQLIDLMVINVHMINFRAVFAFQKQLEQMREALREHQGPVLVAGDFNTWMRARERRVEKFLAEFGLQEVSFQKNKGLRDPRALTFGVLDRAFIRGLEVMHTEVYEEVDSSDHRPFTLQLSLPH